ncbi:hypothetical protein [Bacillus sp. Marseille-P3661]|uniref:hypothetical protein n=1 Tax=Bacillus sp. Marseille-P3661 TaxID=1936234 RepID=UPI000C868587|nr:hypothetical protein [Bacillus sp. Marseille-P3661]
MNNKAINFMKNFSYTLMSNLVSLLVSVLMVLVVPKLLGTEDFGYWQLYLFYSSYVGFLHLGWNDGIYLRYGGNEYKDLNKRLFFSQFYMLVIFQFIVAAIIFSTSIIFLADENKAFIFQMTSLCLIITNLRFMLLFILQGTNRIKEYAMVTISGRILFCSLLIVFLVLGVREFKLLIVIELIGRLLTFAFAIYYCKDIVFRKISTFYFSFREVTENISVGIKLMFANIASMLIIGVVRFGIERSWDVSTFGKVSLTLSISNLMMLFINAVGIILFPILRRTEKDKLPSIYITMRDFLMIFLLGILIFYYPLKVVLSNWLPLYRESLMYLALIFPISVYEGKMALLINTYLRTLRKEKQILKINLLSLAISIVVTFVTTVTFKNLDLAIFSIILILAIRSVLAEIFLSKVLEISLKRDLVLESVIIFVFILSGWFINSWLTLIIYLITYIIYIYIKRGDISKTILNLKLLLSR